MYAPGSHCPGFFVPGRKEKYFSEKAKNILWFQKKGYLYGSLVIDLKTSVMIIKKLSLKNEKVAAFYAASLSNFRKQYKDVAEILALHVNAEGKVFSGEWLDSKNVVNFCGGYAVDCVKKIEFKK